MFYLYVIVLSATTTGICEIYKYVLKLYLQIFILNEVSFIDLKKICSDFLYISCPSFFLLSCKH